MIEIADTLKTGSVGFSGWIVTISGWLPDIISLCIGIATLTYMIIKIKKEL